MELKKGYKRTEVGIIPSDWEVLALKQVLKGIADVDHYMPQTREIGIPYIMTGDLKELVSEIDFDNCKKISIGDFKLLSKKIKNSKGDVILARYATIGTISYVDINFDFVVSYSCVTIKPNPSKLLGVFLFNYFKSSAFKLEVINIINANTQSNVGIGDLYTMKIALPPFTEQTVIATALSDADALISSLEKLIEKKRNIKQGAMQLLLKPKKGWVVKKLGEIVIYKNGTAHENSVVESGDYIIVNSKFISSDAQVAKYSNEILCPVSKDEILMVLSDVPNGKAIAKCFLVEKDNKYTLNQRICSLKSINSDPKFLYYLLNRNPYFLGFDDGAKQTNLRNIDVLNCPLTIPPTIEEQIKIATILLDINTEIELLEKKLSKSKMLKQGMMQELLTGKIRLV